VPTKTPLLICCALSAAAQSTLPPAPLHIVKPMEVQESRYELRMGEPVQIAAPQETLDFLKNARQRSIRFAGQPAAGLVVAPNRTGDMVLAASSQAKPGEYAVAISATSAAGEERQAALTVEVQPRLTVPPGSSRPPVVLLNGWETGFTNSCPVANSSADTFGNLAQYLVSDGVPAVYLFDNCLEDPNATVEQLGNDLGTFLNSIQYSDGTQVPQIDLVAFSLGGLIARSYLAGLQPSGALTPPATTLVRDIVFIATPNFGSFVAATFMNQILTGSQSAEMIPGSALLWNIATWNQGADDLRGVNAIAVIGNAGLYLNTLTSASLSNASDGLVTLASASLGFVSQQAALTRIVPYCQVDPSAFTNIAFGPYECSAPGIANITSTSHPTGQIVRSFLAGTSDWKSIGTTPATDPYLSQDGGMFFALVNAGGAFSADVSSVLWGTVQLQNGADIGTIFYGDFLGGTGVLEPTSSSLGTLSCGQYAIGVGYFSAVRCKVNAAIFSVGPLMSGSARVVASGGTITISGAALGGQCLSCKVVATPAGSTTSQALQVSSWTNTAIKATLPASLTGLVTITVSALTGTDSIAIYAAAAAQSTIAAAPASLQFGYTIGGSVPDAQTIQITNSGSGTLSWTATASDAWLSVSPASGTAPSTLSISVTPGTLSAGTYTSSVQIAASGASNTPLTVPVTLAVSAAPPALAVTPQALSFSYTIGGSPPDAQTVSIANAGSGTLAWTAAANEYWVTPTPTSGSAPGTLSVSIIPGNLAAGTYTGAIQINAPGTAGSPASIAVTLQVQGTRPAGAITAVTNDGSFQPAAASATWLAIFGTGLSDNTYSWQASDFINGMLPTALEGVSVTINGVAAYVEYISPTQINVLAPDDSSTGPVQVQVTTAGQQSNSFTVQKSQFAPAFFTIDNGTYVAAQHADYSLVAASGLLPGVTSTPAHPGETIQLYGTGFGPTNPAQPTGQLFNTAVQLANPAQVTIGGVSATVVFAGLVGPGLYQLNVTVPALPNGDAAVVATVGGVSTQTGVSVTVQQ